MRRQELHPRTAVINKAQKNLSKQARNSALMWLAATFPQAFDNTLCIRPLKAGIMDDVLLHADKAATQGISRSKLREAVVLFTRRIDYLACLKAREMRIDLEGNTIITVTEKEAEQAAQKIKKRIEKAVKNARKAGVAKPTYKQATTNDADPHYLERPPMFSAQTAPATNNKAASVIVKHKTSRAYDPEAVARLKEKLGLSRKNSLKELN